MAGPGAANAKPLPALSGSCGITTLPPKSTPAASCTRCPLRWYGMSVARRRSGRSRSHRSFSHLFSRSSYCRNPVRCAGSAARRTAGAARGTVASCPRSERSSATGSQRGRTAGPEAECADLADACETWAEVGRRKYDVRERSADGRPQPQPQPLKRCSSPRGSPIRPATRRPARGAPGCRRNRHPLQLRRSPEGGMV